MKNDELKLNAQGKQESTYFKKKHMLGKGSVDRTNSNIVKQCRPRQKYYVQETRSSSG